uniref:angiopoietin-related protein 7-like n=1 Tax=Anopheles coluzzii TaxID=1518534 RepID=UPI0020FFC645|nr:angiopoietin-related protein 7-like [Anopheles coluzzii]
MYVTKIGVLVMVALFSIAKVRGVDRNIRDTTLPVFAFEMIITKLEHLLDKWNEAEAAVKQDREIVEQKLAGLTRSIIQQEKTMDQLLTKQQTLLNQMLQDKWNEMKAEMKQDREIVEQKLADVTRSIIHLEKTMVQNLTKQHTQWNEMKAEMKQDREIVDQKLTGVTRSIIQQEKTMDQNLTKQQTLLNQMLQDKWNELKAEMKQDRDIVEQKLASVTRSIIQQEITIDQSLTNVKTQLNQMLTEQTVNAKRKKMKQEIQKLASNNDLARFKASSGLYLQSISSGSCKEEPSKESGKYILQSTEKDEPFLGYCEQTAFGGGWLVFQYRYDGSVDFFRKWTEYRDGFGSMDGEFWLGLEQLHRLTSARKHELLVELKDFDGNYIYARYDEFAIGSEEEQFPLAKLGAYTGTAGESLLVHKGMKFVTKDRNNDLTPNTNCAIRYKGAWWYNKCHDSNLNGLYRNSVDGKNIVWSHYKLRLGLAYTRMLIRET